MFDKEYTFYGSHATRVKVLTNDDKNPNKNPNMIPFFEHNYEVYTLAPLVGFIYNRKAPLNKEDKDTTKIWGDQLRGLAVSNKLEYALRLILLLDKEYETDLDKRIDNAFRLLGTARNEEKDKEYLDLFENYVRGGIDVLYEKLVEKNKEASEPQRYVKNLADFLLDFKEDFNRMITTEKILEICIHAQQQNG